MKNQGWSQSLISLKELEPISPRRVLKTTRLQAIFEGVVLSLSCWSCSVLYWVIKYSFSQSGVGGREERKERQQLLDQVQEENESALRSSLMNIQIYHDHAVSSSGAIQADPPERAESFAFRTCSWKSFVHVFSGRDWAGSHIWLVWPRCCWISAPLGFSCVRAILIPLLDQSSRCDLGRGTTSLWLVFGLISEISMELSLLAGSACVSRRKTGNSDNQKIYVPQNADKYDEKLGISKSWDSWFLT